jgi:putative hemolysin
MNELVQLAIILPFMLILLYLSSWFSSTETAITKLSSSQIAVMKRNKEKNVDYIISVRRKMDHAVASLLVGNNTVNILLASITTLIANMLFHKLGVSIALGILTLLIVMFGEITPKSAAIMNTKKTVQKRAMVLYYFVMAMRPVTILLLWISRRIIRALGGNIKSQNLLVSEDSIKSLATLGESEGVITSMERDLIHGVFTFGDRKVRDILVPMSSVFTLKADMPLADVRRSVAEQQYTRVPVRDATDRVIGIIYSKDLIGKKGDSVASLMREPYIVLDSLEATKVFKAMKSKRIHLGVVQDDKGRHVGIVTLEDILEELVGEIYDEHDDIAIKTAQGLDHQSAPKTKKNQ